MNNKYWFLKRIPLLPLTALLFYLTMFILWSIGIIPPPTGIFKILENLYLTYGLLGLFIASFLEGIVYFGLYFPGSFIVALAVFLSDGSFKSLILISLVVALALTITSFFNYVLGRHFVFREGNGGAVDKNEGASKGLFLSMIHPNSLAFYFFNLGIEKGKLIKIIFVPIIMIPYGLLLAYLLYLFKGPLRIAVENPYVMISVIVIWFVVAFVVEHKRKIKRLVEEI